MGIPKKKSRRIVVDGRSFRWLMKVGCRCWTDCQNPHRADITFQADEKRPGRVCQTALSWTYPDGSVTPEIIRQMIQRALKAGWDPDERGGAFYSESAHVDRFETKASIIKEVMES